MASKKDCDKPEYTRNPSGCRVYVVEVILPTAMSYEAIEDELGGALESLRLVGSAAIVEKFDIVEDMHQATDILHERRIEV